MAGCTRRAALLNAAGTLVLLFLLCYSSCRATTHATPAPVMLLFPKCSVVIVLLFLSSGPGTLPSQPCFFRHSNVVRRILAAAPFLLPLTCPRHGRYSFFPTAVPTKLLIGSLTWGCNCWFHHPRSHQSQPSRTLYLKIHTVKGYWDHVSRKDNMSSSLTVTQILMGRSMTSHQRQDRHHCHPTSVFNLYSFGDFHLSF